MKRVLVAVSASLFACLSSATPKERQTIQLMTAELPMKAVDIASNCFLSRYGKNGPASWWKDPSEARRAMANLSLCEVSARTVGVALKDTVALMRGQAPGSKWVSCFEEEVKALNNDPDGYMARSFVLSPLMQDDRKYVISEFAYFAVKGHISHSCESAKD